jgi:hypothetical protein
MKIVADKSLIPFIRMRVNKLVHCRHLCPHLKVCLQSIMLCHVKELDHTNILGLSAISCWDSSTDQLHETRRTHANTKFIAKGTYRALSLFSVFSTHDTTCYTKLYGSMCIYIYTHDQPTQFNLNLHGLKLHLS